MCPTRLPRRVIVPWVSGRADTAAQWQATSNPFVSYFFSRSLSKRTFPGCITQQKRLKDPLSLSPTSKDVAPCTPGNADVGSRRGGTRSRPGAGPSTLGDPPAKLAVRRGKSGAGRRREPRSDWWRGGVSLDRSRGRKDCHWGQRAATRA